MASSSALTDKLEQLRQLMPEVFSEGKFDYDKFKRLFTEDIDERPERYSFTWAGRREATRLLQAKSRAALIPAKGESVNFDNTKNLFIEGDNLEVLKLLRNSYFNRVKMIYIDPPYNTGNDFIYPDDFKDPLGVYQQLTGQKDENGNSLTTNSEASGRFHSSWLTMMYPRLFVARQLLRADGVIFVSIDRNELHNLIMLMNEIFGEENYISTITVVNNFKGRSDDKFIATANEFLLMYQKGNFDTYGVPLPDEYLDEYTERDEENRPYRLQGLRKRGSSSRREDRPDMYYPFYISPANGNVSLMRTSEDDVEVYPKLQDGADGRWRWGKDTAASRIDELTSRKVSGRDEWDIFQIDYAETDGSLKSIKPKSVWLGSEFSSDTGTRIYKSIMNGNEFPNPKSPNLIRYCLVQSTKDDDIVLDFFAGSGTTAQSVMELNREDGGNRKFILVQVPEFTAEKSVAYRNGFKTIDEISKERIRKVVAKMQDNIPQNRELAEDLGFKVFKLDESHWKQWDGVEEDTPDAYIKQMEMFADPLTEGWTVENLIYEVAVKEGLSLNIRIEKVKDIDANAIYSVNDPETERNLYICLDDKINMGAVASLKLTLDDSFICRAIALDDTTAANIDLQCRLKTL